MILMEKEPCTKFCGILISSHKVMKLQSFESGVSDVTPANVQNISGVLCIYDALPDLVPFVQFKKREKHPWGVLLLVELQANILQLY